MSAEQWRQLAASYAAMADIEASMFRYDAAARLRHAAGSCSRAAGLALMRRRRPAKPGRGLATV